MKKRKELALRIVHNEHDCKTILLFEQKTGHEMPVIPVIYSRELRRWWAIEIAITCCNSFLKTNGHSFQSWLRLNIQFDICMHYRCCFEEKWIEVFNPFFSRVIIKYYLLPIIIIIYCLNHFSIFFSSRWAVTQLADIWIVVMCRKKYFTAYYENWMMNPFINLDSRDIHMTFRSRPIKHVFHDEMNKHYKMNSEIQGMNVNLLLFIHFYRLLLCAIM